MIYVKECLPMFSSRFKSLSHFEFISLQVGRCFLTSLIYTQLSSLPSTLAKEYTCPVHFLHTCVFCQRLIDRKNTDLFLGSLFCFIDIYVCFCTSTELL